VKKGLKLRLRLRAGEKSEGGYLGPLIMPRSDFLINSSIYSLSGEGFISFSINSRACETFNPF
jgi:hypothetical protein